MSTKHEIPIEDRIVDPGTKYARRGSSPRSTTCSASPATPTRDGSGASVCSPQTTSRSSCRPWSSPVGAPRTPDGS